MSLVDLLKKKIGPQIFCILVKGNNKKGESFQQMFVRTGYEFNVVLREIMNEFEKDNGERPVLELYVARDLETLANEYVEGKIALQKIRK